MKVLCLGSKCFAATLLEKLRKGGILEEIHTPINNVEVINGFRDCHKYFDGTFEKEILSDDVKLKYIYRPDWRSQHHFFSDTYHFPHIDLSKKESFDKIRKRFNETKAFIESPTDEYLYFITLHKRDRHLSIDQIKSEIDELSKYIDVDKIIFIGSIPYVGEEKEIDGSIVNTIKYDAINSNFKEVVGDRYIEIYPSNCYGIAAKELLTKINKFIV